MRDLSSVASRWWDLTVRQAQIHYADWKQATPLQRVQIDPKIPDELNCRVYGRTEQRGVHLLLKSVAPEIQQMLVTDRQMTSTAILYRLYIRYQPGIPGEKSLILKELTQLPKTNTMAELATALRSWRRHYGRAREVGASLPDGTLLLRALESGVQLVAKENTQAFSLAQSRSALQVDEIPEPASIWDFSQCLLAEAETLVLMSSSTTSSAETTPLKLKVMEANDTSAPTKLQQEGSSTGKGRGGTADLAPAVALANSANGSTVGRASATKMPGVGIVVQKTIESKTARSKVVDQKAKDETKVSGRGNAALTNKAAGGTSSSTSTMPSSMTSTPTKPQINEMAAASGTSTTLSPGELKTGSPGTDNVESLKGLGDGGTGGEQAAKNEKTAELLHEATQLLKTLRVQPQSPILKVVQIGGLDRTEANMVLIDSGATHGLRPARDHDEWQKGERTTVQLANGSTDAFRLKPGMKILLGPGEPSNGGIMDLADGRTRRAGFYDEVDWKPMPVARRCWPNDRCAGGAWMMDVP